MNTSNPKNITAGCTVRWSDEGTEYKVSRVTEHHFFVEYAGHEYDYPMAAPVEVVSCPRLTPQAQTVLKHMKEAGSITQREALVDHSIQSLTRRITELQDAGIAVKREDKRHPITNQRYARYSLA